MRRPRFTWVSEGNPLRRLLVRRLKGQVFEVGVVVGIHGFGGFGFTKSEQQKTLLPGGGRVFRKRKCGADRYYTNLINRDPCSGACFVELGIQR